MYNSILVFITALFLFNASLPATPPALHLWQMLPLLLVVLAGFYHVAKLFFIRLAQKNVSYQKAELLLSIAALVVFEIILVCCNPLYYWTNLPVIRSVNALQSAGGLALFLLLLAIVWLADHHSAEQQTDAREVVVANLRANLPIILPWLLITLLYDLAQLQPLQAVRSFADSPWGFITIALIALFILPAIMRKIWGCRKMEDGPQRQALSAFCNQLGFATEFYIWPLHGGTIVTAAVIGLAPGFRYVLLTPALLKVMSTEELKAVIAHEAGHVKRGHLLLSILLIAGFSIFTNATLEPVGNYLYHLDFLKQPLVFLGFSPGAISALLNAAPALAAMLLFFRFIFGYFIRNFEREADLYSYTAMGSATPLIAAFEKLAQINGTRKEEKNWHHFGLGERISCLHAAANNPDIASKHRKKLFASLACYFLLVAGVTFGDEEEAAPPQPPLTHQLTLDDQLLVREKSLRFLSPRQKASWYRQVGDILIRKRNERAGIASYERSLQLDPYNPITLNNLAWLLVASEDLALRNPERALDLALEAILWQQNSFFYDTLAAVYWANGMTTEALKAEEKAMALDPARSSYYQRQAQRFRTQNYEELFSLPKDGAKSTKPSHTTQQHPPLNTKEK